MGGLLAAVGITVISFVVARMAEKSVRRIDKTAVAECMVGTAVRAVMTVFGLVVVLMVFGRSWAIPCAMGAIPLYFVELIGSVVLSLRRRNNKDGQIDSEPNQ